MLATSESTKITVKYDFERMLLIPGTGNGEPGTGVWEQVYSGNPLENLKWRSKQKKRLEEKQFGLR